MFLAKVVIVDIHASWVANSHNAWLLVHQGHRADLIDALFEDLILTEVIAHFQVDPFATGILD